MVWAEIVAWLARPKGPMDARRGEFRVKKKIYLLNEVGSGFRGRPASLVRV